MFTCIYITDFKANKKVVDTVVIYTETKGNCSPPRSHDFTRHVSRIPTIYPELDSAKRKTFPEFQTSKRVPDVIALD